MSTYPQPTRIIVPTPQSDFAATREQVKDAMEACLRALRAERTSQMADALTSLNYFAALARDTFKEERGVN